MNDTDKYILESIHTWVWSGFYDPDEVREMIDDILEEDADEAILRAAVAPEFEKKRAAEASWPPETDCDRLDQAFAALDAQGVIALHNAGYTMSDGIGDVGEVLHERGQSGVRGYCFYHGQDVEDAVAGGGLRIAFGDIDDVPLQKTEIGKIVRAELEKQGFRVEWDGDPEKRLFLPDLEWQRRSPG